VRSGRIVVGLSLVAVGVLYLVGAGTDVDAGAIVSDWWPVALIGLGVAQYGIDHSAKLGSAALIVFGVLLLGFTSGLVEGSLWSVLWPTAVILAGIGVMLPRLERNPETTGNTASGFSALGSRVLSSRSPHFEGGELTVILGSLTLDLTEASLAPGAKLSVTAVLGGCEILVPSGWDVRLGGVPVLGGWDDTTRRGPPTPNAPVLTVRAVAVLAGVEVRHPTRWNW
jgi:hypothetical protein